MPTLAIAYQIFGDQKYLDAAYKAADYTYIYGVLTIGMGLCHGVSSNVYMILHLYQITMDPKLLYYAF